MLFRFYSINCSTKHLNFTKTEEEEKNVSLPTWFYTEWDNSNNKIINIVAVKIKLKLKINNKNNYEFFPSKYRTKKKRKKIKWIVKIQRTRNRYEFYCCFSTRIKSRLKHWILVHWRQSHSLPFSYFFFEIFEFIFLFSHYFVGCWTVIRVCASTCVSVFCLGLRTFKLTLDFALGGIKTFKCDLFTNIVVYVRHRIKRNRCL